MGEQSALHASGAERSWKDEIMLWQIDFTPEMVDKWPGLSDPGSKIQAILTQLNFDRHKLYMRLFYWVTLKDGDLPGSLSFKDGDLPRFSRTVTTIHLSKKVPPSLSRTDQDLPHSQEQWPPWLPHSQGRWPPSLSKKVTSFTLRNEDLPGSASLSRTETSLILKDGGLPHSQRRWPSSVIYHSQGRIKTSVNLKVGDDDDDGDDDGDNDITTMSIMTMKKMKDDGYNDDNDDDEDDEDGDTDVQRWR